MDSKNRRQRNYMRKMLDKSVKKHKEFDSDINRQNFENQMKFIKKKYSKSDTEVSPNGGRTPFNPPID